MGTFSLCPQAQYLFYLLLSCCVRISRYCAMSIILLISGALSSHHIPFLFCLFIRQFSSYFLSYKHMCDYEYTQPKNHKREKHVKFITLKLPPHEISELSPHPGNQSLQKHPWSRCDMPSPISLTLNPMKWSNYKSFSHFILSCWNSLSKNVWQLFIYLCVNRGIVSLCTRGGQRITCREWILSFYHVRPGNWTCHQP